MQPHHPRHRSKLLAFTLIEVLLVIIIIGALLAVTTPAIQGAVAASRLRDSAASISSELFEAQQLAITQGTETEVRIYQLPDLADPDPSPVLRKVQVFTLSQPPDGPSAGEDAQGLFIPVGSPTSLGTGIIISSSTVFSSVVARGFQTDNHDHLGRFVAFRFHADGSTDLTPNKEWFLTLVERKLSQHTVKPKNFVTLQIDPASGHVRSFQP